MEEIEVHFEADQLSRELSLRQKNESPSIPQGMGRGYSNNGESEYYEDEGEEVDYRNMMLMNQMQQRPGNQDLQDYYQRGRSKERRRTSNSKQQQQQRKSTEKIYMQRLDKRRY